MARIINTTLYGHIVTVIEAAPSRDFRLPNGVLHIGVRPGWWVCESMGKEFPVKRKTAGGAVLAAPNRFAVIADRCLRPIRPQAAHKPTTRRTNQQHGCHQCQARSRWQHERRTRP